MSVPVPVLLKPAVPLIGTAIVAELFAAIVGTGAVAPGSSSSDPVPTRSITYPIVPKTMPPAWM